MENFHGADLKKNRRGGRLDSSREDNLYKSISGREVQPASWGLGGEKKKKKNDKKSSGDGSENERELHRPRKRRYGGKRTRLQKQDGNYPYGKRDQGRGSARKSRARKGGGEGYLTAGRLGMGGKKKWAESLPS